MSVRIVVADESKALFYDVERAGATPAFVGELSDPQARLHDRDLKSDRPGRVFDHAAQPGRRGATAHHSTGGEHEAHKHEVESFARTLAHALETAHQHGDFRRLVVMAGPKFLGVLRQMLPRGVTATIVAEVPKDLVHQPAAAFLSHLPAEAFKSTD